MEHNEQNTPYGTKQLRVIVERIFLSNVVSEEDLKRRKVGCGLGMGFVLAGLRHMIGG